MSAPAVSVVMAAWNAEATIGEAIRSILAQTHADFELIIIDDGSSDDTNRAVVVFNDDRIHLIASPKNLGLAPSLNIGIAAARGEFIARIDADDGCRPERLERQLAFMQQHPEVGMVGTAFDVMDEASRIYDRRSRHGGDEYCQTELLVWNPFCAGSAMMRRGLLEELGGYDERFPTSEDYDLWLRIAERARMAILPEVLYCWRTSAGSMTHADHPRQLRYADDARELAWQRRTTGRDTFGRDCCLQPGKASDRRRFSEHHIIWAREALRQHRWRDAANLALRAACSGPLNPRLLSAVLRMPAGLLRWEKRVLDERQR